MRSDERCLKLLRATIEAVDNHPDRSMISWCLRELEDIEHHLLETELEKEEAK